MKKELETIRRTPPPTDLVRELRDAGDKLYALCQMWERPSNDPERDREDMANWIRVSKGADVHLEGRESQNYSAAQIAALQEAAGRVLYACEGADDDGDLTERVTGDMLFALRQALEALRRYPDAEPPKEGDHG